MERVEDVGPRGTRDRGGSRAARPVVGLLVVLATVTAAVVGFNTYIAARFAGAPVGGLAITALVALAAAAMLWRVFGRRSRR